MQLSRAAAVALMGAAAFCATAPAAFADSSGDWRVGEVEASPHVVHPGHWVALSTEDCRHAAKVHVDLDGVHHKIWLTNRTDEGLTGYLFVPWDTDPGRYEVEGHCVDRHRHGHDDGWDHHRGREIEGSFFVEDKHHDDHHRDMARGS